MRRLATATVFTRSPTNAGRPCTSIRASYPWRQAGCSSTRTALIPPSCRHVQFLGCSHRTSSRPPSPFGLALSSFTMQPLDQHDCAHARSEACRRRGHPEDPVQRAAELEIRTHSLPVPQLCPLRRILPLCYIGLSGAVESWKPTSETADGALLPVTRAARYLFRKFPSAQSRHALRRFSRSDR